MKRAVVIAISIALAGSLLIGCGGSAGTGSTDAQAQMEQFQSCLADHGAAVPGPGGARPSSTGGSAPQPPSGSPPKMSAKTEKAMQACNQYLPVGGPAGGAPPTGAPPAGAPPVGASPSPSPS
jgi:hypothetical protein